MKILLGSKSEKKINAVKGALEYLNIDYDLECFKVESNVSDNPLNEETIVGAKNRNNNLKKLNIDYDMLISIEAGFTKEDDKYYVDTYCVVNYNGEDYIGMSPRLNITETVYDYVSKGNVLHLLVQELQETNTDEGVVGYLSSGKLKRTEMEMAGVIDALIKALNLNNTGIKIDVDSNLDIDKVNNLDKAIKDRMGD